MKQIIVTLFLVVMVTMGIDCEPTSDTKQRDAQEKILMEGTKQTGMPSIVNFQERKLLKMIIELRDRSDLICHCYLVNEMNGEVGQYLGKCLGYGLPYATQYTSPQKSSGSGYSLPQADPNGLFSPASAEATWVLLINPENNQPTPTYIEGRVLISQFKLK